MHLVRAAQIVRKEMFEKKNLFDGSFKHSTEQEAVAPSLMAFVRMILDGPSIKHQSDTGMSTLRAALSISQILMFNSVNIVEAQILLITVVNDIIVIVKCH